MKDLNGWLRDYAVSHQNPKNILIHKVCVPLIMFSIFGLLWAIPFPISSSFVWLNWATIFVFLASLFYLTLGIKVFVLMVIQSVLMLFIVSGFTTNESLISTSSIIFILGWIGQFIGHKIEGKKPSFFNDLQFLFIGPIWVWSFFRLK